MTKEQEDNYTRKWMRDCVNFWMRQYREVKRGDSVYGRRLSYEQACVMTAGADCPCLWTSGSHWMTDRKYTREEVIEIFNSEFSEDFEKCVKKYGTQEGGPYKIIKSIHN